MSGSGVRVGIVGCGGIAREHLAAYRAAGATIVSVFDVKTAAAAAFAAETGARAAASLVEMAERDRPAAVSVCTPPGVHLDNCRPLLAAGIGVLCEKPLAATLADATALAAAAAASKAPFMVAYCHRFHPPVIELKTLIAAGTLGTPLLFRNIFAGYMDLVGNHRVNKALSGGGTMIDNGSHSSDLFRHLAGEPTAVQALTATVMQKIPVEDFALIHLRTAGAAHGEITLSHSLKVAGNWVEWYGTKGTAVISYWNEGFPDLAYRLEGQDAWTPVDTANHPDRFEGEIRHFLDCVRTGKPPVVGAADGLAAARIMDAAYRSAADGRLVPVAP